VTTPKAQKSSFQLLRNLNVYDVADMARTAMLDFLSGTGSGWSRRELALWLAGAYFRATAPVSGPAVRRTVLPVAELSSDVGIERVLLSTHDALIELAEHLASGDLSLAHAMVERKAVIGVQDALGGVGYAAAGGVEGGLCDRVSALMIADYLTRPADYQALHVCSECALVSFDWAPRHHEACEGDPRVSGVVPKRSERVLGDVAGRRRP
jgi:hypothetical protein